MGRQCVELGGCMSQQFYTMKELPVSERPYEKAKEQGVTALSDAELLAVLLKCLHCTRCTRVCWGFII